MSQRKIKDAKDLETDELIYFKGHAKAVYMSDGRNVEEAINDAGNSGITTETDPIFSSSAAAKITDSNISTWDGKQDKISDLATIRSGAAKGATAIQEHQDISGKQDKIQVVSKGTSDTTFTIESNKFYVWGSVSSLDITLGTLSDASVYNEYIFQFTSGSIATTLSLPSSVKWQSEPKVEENKTYQVSIVDNIGLIVGV